MQWSRELSHTHNTVQEPAPFTHNEKPKEDCDVNTVIDFIKENTRFKGVGDFFRAFTTSKNQRIATVRGCFHESKSQRMSSRIIVTWLNGSKSTLAAVLPYLERIWRIDTERGRYGICG
jgi:hypothetical protein